MKKAKVLLLALIFMTSITINASEIGEVTSQIDELNSQITEVSKQLEAKNLDLAQQEAIVNELDSKLAILENEIGLLESDIKKLETDLENNNKKKIQMEKDVEESKEFTKVYLEFLQSNKDKNIVIDTIFAPDSATNVFQGMQATLQFSSATQEITNDLMRKILDLEKITEKMQSDEKVLEQKNNQLVSQRDEVSASQQQADGVRSQIAMQQMELSEKESQIAQELQAQEETKAALESAGCSAGEVYGVDCGNTDMTITSTGSFIRPTNSGYMMCDYGCYPGHTGIDIGGSTGTPIYPAAPGTVLSTSSESGGGGNMVFVIHLVDGVNYVTSYMHLDSFSVSPGQSVDVNTQLGTMGNTGMTTATHVHFGITPGSSWLSSSAVDPRGYVNFPPQGASYSSR